MSGNKNRYHSPGADGRMHAPATERNRDYILDVLRDVLPNTGTILEVAAGTGEHAVYMAPSLAPRLWLPTDVDEGRLQSIRAWIRTAPSDNLLDPRALDVSAKQWAVEETPPPSPVTAVLAINLIHIAPWDVCLGLMAGAGRILPADGVLYLYGPYKRDGAHTAPSNEAFDASLRTQDPDWGVRDLNDVEAEALKAGLILEKVVEMPANNLSVVFKKPPPDVA